VKVKVKETDRRGKCEIIGFKFKTARSCVHAINQEKTFVTSINA
jgi:hypothetical protein